MEKVDVVDKNLNFLKIVCKNEAHKKGLLHSCVVAMIRRSNGDYLLVKQAADRQDPGQFVSPVGGHVSSGESINDALKREAFEEVGFKNFEYKPLGKAI